MAKPISEKRLYNISLFYLSKYESSTFKLRQMLKRRVSKAAIQEEFVPENVEEIIGKVVGEMQRLGYINDERYAQSQVRVLSRQGKSGSFIRQKLKQDGISIELAEKFLKENEVTDVEQACVWLKRHRKGGYRLTKREEDYKKDLAALARQGFSFAEAQEALKVSFEESNIPHFEEDAFL